MCLNPSKMLKFLMEKHQSIKNTNLVGSTPYASSLLHRYNLRTNIQLRTNRALRRSLLTITAITITITTYYSIYNQ